jgi:hypothetical protein
VYAIPEVTVLARRFVLHLTALATLGVSQSLSAQIPPVTTGTRIRYKRVAAQGGRWESGRLSSITGDTLRVEHGDAIDTIDSHDLATLQASRRNGRGALIGAAIGALAGPIAVAVLRTAAGSSDVAGLAVVGGLTEPRGGAESGLDRLVPGVLSLAP